MTPRFGDRVRVKGQRSSIYRYGYIIGDICPLQPSFDSSRWMTAMAGDHFAVQWDDASQGSIWNCVRVDRAEFSPVLPDPNDIDAVVEFLLGAEVQ